jgi:putative ABC transport system permease protein
METLFRDLRNGVRVLARRPGFTAVAVLTLALGIGANTTLFSIVHGVLLKPLPHQDPERLVFLWNSIPSADVDSFPLSPAEYAHYRTHVEAFQDLAMFTPMNFNLGGREMPERIAGALVSDNLFHLLGTHAASGRAFTPGNALEERDTVLISHGVWQRLFGAGSEIIGQTIVLNDVPRKVIGVMPPGFDFPGGADLWEPAILSPESLGRGGLGQQSARTVARLEEGFELPVAQQVMDGAARRFHHQYADFYEGAHPWKVTLVPMHQQVTGPVRMPLMVLFGSVTLVLLVACANVSNLLLTRARARQSELAIRATLGAGTLRLARMLLTEGVLLALLGGGAGLLMTYWGIDAVRALAPDGIPRLGDVHVDGAVLAFTLAISVVTGLFLTTLPALQTTRFDLQHALKQGAQAGAVGRSRGRAKNLLVVAELSLAFILSISAGLLAKSYLQLTQVDPGFDPQSLLSMRISLSPIEYRDPERAAAFYLDAIQEIEPLPGVLAVGGVSALPLSGRSSRAAFTVEDGDASPIASETAVHFRLVTPGYFQAMSIPLLQGRPIRAGDDGSAPLVLTINQTMARLLWPGRDPLGRRIAFDGPDGPWHRVVAVVGDVKHFGLDAEPEMAVYVPYMQADDSRARSITLVVRTSADPERLANEIRSRISSVDSNQPVYEMRPVTAVLGNSVAPHRFNMLMMSGFAVLCLVLAAIGIYGVISYSVGQRTHEVGIRVAMGARASDVVRLVVGEGALLTLIGLVVGAGGAFAATRLLSGLLFGVQPTDAMTFVAVSVLLASVALLASYVPARRAAHVDPIVALRYE